VENGDSVRKLFNINGMQLKYGGLKEKQSQ
jgi:hypothetical protein